MGLEAATYISDLVATNPVGNVDDYATADDHLRLIKAVLQNQFGNLNAAVTSTDEDLNILSGAAVGGLTNAELMFLATTTSNVQDQLDSKVPNTRAIITAVSSGLSGGADLSTDVTLVVVPGDISHNLLANYVPDQHVAHSGISVTGGTGLAGGGTIDGNQVLTLSHLGLETLSDPAADRIMFWDDGTPNALAWLTVSTGLSLTGTNLTTNDAAIVHNNLSGVAANEHIDHSTVTLTAGDGLSGGGTIAANRSFAVDSTVIRTTGAQNVYGAKTFDTYPTKNTEGAALFHAAAANTSGKITVSTAAPTGGANGDIWLRY